MKNIIVILLALITFSACDNVTKSIQYIDDSWLTDKDTFLTPEILADSHTKVEIRTPYGIMLAILYDETPKHKANFIKLTKSGFYDSTLFHRVIEQFMIQGGDPYSKDAGPGVRLGDGGPGYTIPAEMHPHLIHKKGALSAARMGDNMNPDKESSGSQFYIVHGMKYEDPSMLTTDFKKIFELIKNPKYSFLQKQLNNTDKSSQEDMFRTIISFKDTIEKLENITLNIDYPEDRLKIYKEEGGTPNLDENYTVFGQVIKGLDVIDKIANNKVDNSNRPLENIPMVVKIID